MLGTTKEQISQAFAAQFPSYDKLMCGSFSLESGPLAHNHLYLFMTPQDQERAKASGDIEKLAYDIVKAKDIFGYIPYEKYDPQIKSRRELTTEQIFFVDRG